MSTPTTRAQSPTPLLSVAGFRKFTPAQYHKLIDHGIIAEGEPVELLDYLRDSLPFGHAG